MNTEKDETLERHLLSTAYFYNFNEIESCYDKAFSFSAYKPMNVSIVNELLRLMTL